MKQIKLFAIVASLMFLGSKASAQDTQTDNHTITVVVPNVALLDLEATSKNFTSTFAQPTPLEAGEKLTAPANNADLWLNYSSIVAASGITSRRVQAKISALVPGVDIAVTAAAAVNGAGTRGAGSTITLTATDQNLVTGIGSAYTGTGINNGHNLTYAFNALDANYGSLRAASPVVTVTYTLVDN